jgi:hypothetical protein
LPWIQNYSVLMVRFDTDPTRFFCRPIPATRVTGCRLGPIAICCARRPSLLPCLFAHLFSPSFFFFLKGVNTVTGEIKASPFKSGNALSALQREATTTGKRIVGHKVLIDNSEQFSSLLDIEAEVSGGGWGFSAKAGMDFSRSVKMNSKFVYIYQSVTFRQDPVVLPTPAIQQLELTENARGLLYDTNGNPSELRRGTFRKKYGDALIVGFVRGGRAQGVLTCHTNSTAEKTAIRTYAKAKFGGFGFSASASFEMNSETERVATNVRTTSFVSLNGADTARQQDIDFDNFQAQLAKNAELAQNGGEKLYAVILPYEAFDQIPPPNELWFEYSVYFRNLRRLNRSYNKLEYVANSCESYLNNPQWVGDSVEARLQFADLLGEVNEAIGRFALLNDPHKVLNPNKEIENFRDDTFPPHESKSSGSFDVDEDFDFFTVGWEAQLAFEALEQQWEDLPENFIVAMPSMTAHTFASLHYGNANNGVRDAIWSDEKTTPLEITAVKSEAGTLLSTKINNRTHFLTWERIGRNADNAMLKCNWTPEPTQPDQEIATACNVEIGFDDGFITMLNPDKSARDDVETLYMHSRVQGRTLEVVWVPQERKHLGFFRRQFQFFRIFPRLHVLRAAPLRMIDVRTADDAVKKPIRTNVKATKRISQPVAKLAFTNSAVKRTLLKTNLAKASTAKK